MRKGASGVSPIRLLVILGVVVIITVISAVLVHGYFNKRYNEQLAEIQRTTARPAVVLPIPTGGASGDWIGFHNGGGLSGTAPAIAAPPMKVRWTLRMDDLEAADVPATVPATLPVAAPLTSPAAVPATLPATGPTSHPTTAPTTTSAYHSPGHFEAGAAIVRGMVYVADTAGAVRAIDAATGKVRWTFHAEDGFETTPLVLGGRVFIGDLGGMFYALSAENGDLVWHFDAGSAIHASANYLAPDQTRILFATDGADIFCMDAATGKQIWNGKSGDRVNGVPAVSNGSALVSGCDSQLRALKGVDGTEEYSTDLGAICPGSTAVAGDNLVLGTDQGRVLCISATTHKQVWLFDQVQGNAMVYSSPAVFDGVVVFGARDSRVYGLDLATGKELWHFATRGDVDSSPIISGGRVYIGSKDKKLYVLDLKTGKQLWSFTAGRGITASPAIANGILIIADEGGHLFCLE